MDEETRIHFVARAFPSLQGWRWVPFALAFAINPWFQGPGHWDLGVVAILLALAVLLSVPIGRYYRDHFGYLRRRAPTGWRQVAGMGLPIAFYLLFLGYQYLEVRLGLPVSALGLVWVTCFGAAFLVAPRPRWYWGAVAAVLLGVALLPAFGVSSGNELFGQHSRLGAGLVGVGGALCGVMDHRLLVSLLRPLPEGGDPELAG